ncbi:MAG: pseudouridine synthase [Candidatus Limivicinus sp.]
MPIVRLDKLMGDMGIASRKELKQIIRSGRVSVDGIVVTVPETKVDGEKNRVFLDSRELLYSRFHYYMLNKPRGILSATEDGRQRTVLDLVTPEMRRMGLFPVGRLDKDTSGLLLLTDDGNFAHRVISPKSGVEKLYYAKVDGSPSDADAEAFENGIILADGTRCLPAKLEITGEHECLVRVMEGKYHQVRRMLASRKMPVLELRRLSIGALKLDPDLAPGKFRELEQGEIDKVFKAT